MNLRVLGSVTGAVVLMAWTAPGPAIGQTTAPPRWNPPRLGDGQPDMQGHWISDAVGAAHSVEDGRDPADDVIQNRIGERNPVVIVDPPDRHIPYQQAAAARRTQLLRDMFTPTQVEHVDPHIRALLDGGNTLVVDITNFNDSTWIDSHGSFHSDALHVVERWTLVGPDRIEYEATLEDSKVFTRPWRIAFQVNRNKQANYEIFEDARHEGEQDVAEIVLGGRRAKEAGVTGIHDHRREGR